MLLRNVYETNGGQFLAEGNLSIMKDSHGWRIVIDSPDGDIWRVSTYLVGCQVLARDPESFMLCTSSGNRYLCSAANMSGEEAARRICKSIRFIW